MLALVSLATFELFIKAVDVAVSVFSRGPDIVKLRNDLLGASLSSAPTASWDLIALAVMWIIAGAALCAALANVVFLLKSESLPASS